LTGLTFAAVFLTRFDLLVLIAPVVLLLIYSQRGNWKVIAIAVGAFAFPLIVWFTWSWLTYNTLLPNTFAAKRNVDIPQIELVIQGIRYFFVSFEHDPVILILLVMGILGGFIFGSFLLRAWTLGVVLYLAYVISIGGDFMASRFMAVPAMVSALILASVSLRPDSDAKQSPIVEYPRNDLSAPSFSITTLVFLLVGSSLAGSTPVALANFQGPRWEFEQNTNAGISDERGFYVATGKGLKELLDKLSLAYINPDIAPLGDGSGLNRSLREINKAAQNWPYNDGGFTNPSEVGVFCGGLGYLGIATGPITHLVDSCALTDRFLAQQAFIPAEPFAWRTGHFSRAIPDGYLDALSTGDFSRVLDPRLAFELDQLWQEIR
jgi:arabinofuranosyltransferase